MGGGLPHYIGYQSIQAADIRANSREAQPRPLLVAEKESGTGSDGDGKIAVAVKPAAGAEFHYVPELSYTSIVFSERTGDQLGRQSEFESLKKAATDIGSEFEACG
jgi:hypothetical protein